MRKKFGPKAIEAAEWIKAHKNDAPLKVLCAQIIEKTHLSTRTIDKARKILADGIPELVELLKVGKVTITPAYHLACSDNETQLEAVQCILIGGKLNYSAYTARLSNQQQKEFKDHIQQIRALVAQLQSYYDQNLYSEYLIQGTLKQLITHLNAL